MDFDFILVGNADGILSNLPKALKASGFSILVIGAPGMPLTKSPWIDSSIVLSSATQSLFLEELFTNEELLNELSGTFLWSSDQIMREVAESKAPLKLKLKMLPTRNENYLEMLGSKIGQFEKMSGLGIPYPESQPIESKSELAVIDLAVQGKALAKGDNSGGGAQVRIFESVSKEELLLIPDEWFPILLQEFVPANRIGVEAYYKDGELVQWFYSIVESDLSPLGPSMGRTYLIPKSLDFLDHLEKIGKSANLDGFINVSLLLDPVTGLHQFFEFDSRPNVWHHIFNDFSVPFKEIWNKEIKFLANNYLPVPVRRFEPVRLFKYFLERWNLIGAIRVVQNKEVTNYGTAISSVFYGPDYKSLNIIKLILLPIAPLTKSILKVLVILKKRTPNRLSAWIDKSKVKAVLLKFLSE
jgi:hypothetical protein